MIKRSPLIAAAAMAVAAAALLLAFQPPQTHVAQPAAAAIGAPFTLTDQHGKTVKDTEFAGRSRLVFFGYTHCPDICPIALATLGDALKQLGPEADRAAVLFVSLDPDRDTPARLNEYLASFDARIHGLTGSPEALRALVKAFKSYFRPNDENAALIDHSGYIFLMDGNGGYVKHFEQNAPAAEIVQGLREEWAR